MAPHGASTKMPRIALQPDEMTPQGVNRVLEENRDELMEFLMTQLHEHQTAWDEKFDSHIETVTQTIQSEFSRAADRKRQFAEEEAELRRILDTEKAARDEMMAKDLTTIKNALQKTRAVADSSSNLAAEAKSTALEAAKTSASAMKKAVSFATDKRTAGGAGMVVILAALYFLLQQFSQQAHEQNTRNSVRSDGVPVERSSHLLEQTFGRARC